MQQRRTHVRRRPAAVAIKDPKRREHVAAGCAGKVVECRKIRVLVGLAGDRRHRVLQTGRPFAPDKAWRLLLLVLHAMMVRVHYFRRCLPSLLAQERTDGWRIEE